MRALPPALLKSHRKRQIVRKLYCPVHTFRTSILRKNKSTISKEQDEALLPMDLCCVSPLSCRLRPHITYDNTTAHIYRKLSPISHLFPKHTRITRCLHLHCKTRTPRHSAGCQFSLSSPTEVCTGLKLSTGQRTTSTWCL